MTEQQFLSVYDELSDSLFRHCLFRTGDREIGKDLMQESFLRTWEYVSSGQKIENCKAFLYKIANNLIIDWARRQKKRQVVSLEDLSEEGFEVAGTEDTAQKTRQHFTERQIATLLSQIEEPYRTAVILRYIDELSPKEIAKTLGISANATSVRINRGMERLRSLLHDG